jgi:hypothetical protein
MLSSKWILFCFLITTFFLSTYSQPTPTTRIVKRQEEISSVADYHHVTISRTTTGTATATATATETKKGNGGKGGGGSSTTTSRSNDRNPEPTVIPAKTNEWYSMYFIKLAYY